MRLTISSLTVTFPAYTIDCLVQRRGALPPGLVVLISSLVKASLVLGSFRCAVVLSTDLVPGRVQFDVSGARKVAAHNVFLNHRSEVAIDAKASDNDITSNCR